MTNSAVQTSKTRDRLINLSERVPTMNLITKDVTRSVDNPQGGEKIERKAVVTFPSFGTFDEKGNIVAGSVTVDDLVNALGGTEKVADLVNSAIEAKVRSIAFNELGKGDKSLKKIAKAVKAMKAVPGFTEMSENDIRAILMQNPAVQAELANVNVEKEISLAVSVERLFQDLRGKKDGDEDGDEDETSEAAA